MSGLVEVEVPTKEGRFQLRRRQIGMRSRGCSLLFQEIFLASLAPTSRTRTYPFFSPEWRLGLSWYPRCPVSMAKMVLSKVRLKEKAPSSYPRLLAISKTLVPMDCSSSISTLQGHSWVVVEVWEERAWWASWELTLRAVHRLSCKLQTILYLYCWHSCSYQWSQNKLFKRIA